MHVRTGRRKRSQIIKGSKFDFKSKRHDQEDAHDHEELIEKIKERFKKIDLSVSSYDTAWVAMVPSNRDLSNQPCFPDCLEWILENQKADGSWGLNPGHPTLVKDSLSSTLASVLALQKWRVGEQLVHKGFHISIILLYMHVYIYILFFFSRS